MTKKMKEKVKANFIIDKEYWERYKKVADANNDNASRLIREFIKSYLKENSQLSL